MNIKITTDSTCDLSPELLAEYGIEKIPLYVLMDGQAYQDGVDITQAEIIRHVENGGELCCTASVNIRDYIEFFKWLSPIYDAVIHINIGSQFSGCYQNATVAAQDFDNVYVIDSKNLSTGQGHIAIEAAKLSGSLDVKSLCKYLVDLTERVESSFLIERLDYMLKGGRCSAVAALGANIFKLKPCIEIADGKMRVAKKYRGSIERCINTYVKERLADRTDIKYERIFITHETSSQMVEFACNAIKQYGNFENINAIRAGCTILCHCGPGTLGIFFVRKQ